jgi:hypothetical protein
MKREQKWLQLLAPLGTDELLLRSLMHAVGVLIQSENVPAHLALAMDQAWLAMEQIREGLAP